MPSKPAKPRTTFGIRDPKAPQTPAASIDEVARLAGVSTATVSRVINNVPNKASQATRERVLRAVEALSYLPSRAGRALRQKRSHIVGVLAPDLGNAYHALISGSIERALREQGLVMVLANTGEDPDLQDAMLREMRALQVFGVVMLGAVESPELQHSLKSNEPLVFVNRRCPYDVPARHVGIDNVLAAGEVAEYLFSRHHRGAWIFHAPLKSSASRDRVTSFQRKFQELAGADCPLPEIVVSTRRRDSAYQLARQHISAEAPPRAIFCTTDEIAYGVARHCLEIGLSLPQDVTIFGFDGNPMNEFLAPWLSTVRSPYELFGPAVVGALGAFYDEGEASRPLDSILPFEILLSDGLHPTRTSSTTGVYVR
jgi:LacI family transcriptional regulator